MRTALIRLMAIWFWWLPGGLRIRRAWVWKNWVWILTRVVACGWMIAERPSVPGLWAAGGVTGQAWLAHAASRMAEVVVHNLTGRPDRMRYDKMPAVVYTSPEVAVVGLTKDEAESRGLKVKTGRIPMAINARYLAENPDESGLCKVVLEAETNRLLGVHMVGGACSEMIFGATAMLETEMREEEIEEIVFPHPTTSEIMKGVFMAVR